LPGSGTKSPDYFEDLKKLAELKDQGLSQRQNLRARRRRYYEKSVRKSRIVRLLKDAVKL
jgi:hypothetical protein